MFIMVVPSYTILCMLKIMFFLSTVEFAIPAESKGKNVHNVCPIQRQHIVSGPIVHNFLYASMSVVEHNVFPLYS